jgi:hypothetical protein
VGIRRDVSQLLPAVQSDEPQIGAISMFDFIRATPAISPTSPGSGTTTNGTTTTVSAFGSGTNENQFLIDGTNFTCPCNGVARSEPGVDFIMVRRRARTHLLRRRCRRNTSFGTWWTTVLSTWRVARQ